jgi:hypothetical protein
MSPVTSRRIICRRRKGDAGVSQSAFLAAFLALILVIIAVFVVLAPIIGGTAANYWLCQLLRQDASACGDPNTAAPLPGGVGVRPGDPIPLPETNCIIIGGPISLPPVCTTEDGETAVEVQMDCGSQDIIQGLVDDVNGSGSLGNYLEQMQAQYPVAGAPPIPPDLEGYVEKTDCGIRIVIPNDEAHADLWWWVNAAISGAIGIAVGFAAAGLCFASLAPVPPPGLAASVACVAIRGYVTGFVGSMLYQLIDGKSLADPYVWGRSIAAGIVSAIGSGLWESGINNFMKNESGPMMKKVTDWIIDQLGRFKGWLGDKYGAALEGARGFMNSIAEGMPAWIAEAARNAGIPVT